MRPVILGFLAIIEIGGEIGGITSWASAEHFELKIDPNQGVTHFIATGNPSAIKVKGDALGPEGTLRVEQTAKAITASGVFEISLDGFKTGIDLRDRHMREKYLETGKFPKAKLEISNLPLPESLAAENGNAEIPLTGTLTLHGISRSISGRTALKRDGQQVLARSSFHLNLKDYQITIPSFAGVTIAKDVTVEVHFNAPIPKSR